MPIICIMKLCFRIQYRSTHAQCVTYAAAHTQSAAHSHSISHLHRAAHSHAHTLSSDSQCLGIWWTPCPSGLSDRNQGTLCNPISSPSCRKPAIDRDKLLELQTTWGVIANEQSLQVAKAGSWPFFPQVSIHLLANNITGVLAPCDASRLETQD
jgi:hypothetical protein